MADKARSSFKKPMSLNDSHRLLCDELQEARSTDLDKCDAERALATVELLCRIPTGCAALAGHALTVPLLVKTILKISDRATEYAAGALLALCSATELSQREAVAAGVLTQLLLLVQSDCTERAKRKAQMLVQSDCTGSGIEAPPSGKPVPQPGTYVIQVPKDQVYRVPPPENARRYNHLTKRKSRRGCCCGFCCCLFTILLVLILAAGIAAAAFYFVFRPESPKYTVGHSETQFFSFKLVRFCSLKLSNLHYARSIFNHLHSPNVFLYTAMITAYASQPDHLSAIDLFRRMLRRGLPRPNHFIYPHVLKSGAEVTKLVHTQIMKSGFSSYPVVQTTATRSATALCRSSTSRRIT